MCSSDLQRYGAIIRLWENAWEQFIPFLDYDVEIRTVLCSTNAIESLNARYRRAIKARGHFPTEQAALKCLYLVTRSLDPTGTGQARWTMRWKPALNAFAITFSDRFRPLRLTNPTAGNTVSEIDPRLVTASQRLLLIASMAWRSSSGSGSAAVMTWSPAWIWIVR